MPPEMMWARDAAAKAMASLNFAELWRFEDSPPSPDDAEAVYLRAVAESDVMIFICGYDITPAVSSEVMLALASGIDVLVFVLDLESYAPSTERLLETIHDHVKSGHVRPEPAALEAAVVEAFNSLAADRVRGDPPIRRRSLLQFQLKQSHARCTTSWMALGVHESLAIELAADEDMGNPGDLMRPSAGEPLKVLTGGVGSGKSLAAERMFQRAIRAALADPASPIPIFLEARSVATSLQERMAQTSTALGDSLTQGVFLVVDGLDEGPTNRSRDLLEEARVVVRSYPHSAAVLTGRPLYAIQDASERIEVPRLEPEQVESIVARLTGETIAYEAFVAPFSQSLKDASRVPLFTIALALQYNRFKAEPETFTRSDLIRALVESAVERSELDAMSTNRLLSNLAVSCFEENHVSVPWQSVCNTRADVLKLLASRIVIEHHDRIEFALQLFSEWFGAQALAGWQMAAITALSNEPDRADRWRYSLLLYSKQLPLDKKTALVGAFAQRDIAIAGEMVAEAIAMPLNTDWSVEAMAQGVAFRKAVQDWAEAFVPSNSLWPSFNERGLLRPLLFAIDQADNSFDIAWYFGVDNRPDVTLVDDGDSSWKGRRHFEFLPDFQLWQYAVARSLLIEQLDDAIGLHKLRADGPLPAAEMLWFLLHRMLDIDEFDERPIDLLEAEKALNALGDGDVELGDGARAAVVNVGSVKGNVRKRIESGEAELVCPWPPRDQPEETTEEMPWLGLSPQRLLDRTAAIYGEALGGYLAIVDSWLPSLANRLAVRVSMPAKVDLRLVPARGNICPQVDYVFEPLLIDGENQTTVAIGKELRDDFSTLARLRAAIRERRPKVAGRLPLLHIKEDARIYGLRPVTGLVYEWIHQDLRLLGWSNIEHYEVY